MKLTPIAPGRDWHWHPVRYSYKPVLYRNRGGGITFSCGRLLYWSWKR